MSEFGSKLRRRIWLPFLLLTGVAVAAGVCFTFFLPLTPAFFWSYTALLVLLALGMAAVVSQRLVASLQSLAKLTEQAAPGSLERAAQHPDEIGALAQTITEITTEMRAKEQTWMGDLEKRNRAVQELSRTLQEQATSFETALNAVDWPVCLFEANGNVLQVNQSFCRFLGVSAESLKTMGLLRVVAELRRLVASPEELTRAAEAIFRKPSAPSDTLFPFKDRTGSLRLYCVPIFGEISSLIGIIVSAGEGADATAVDRLKGEFISTVSHELRTPLTAIKGAVGLILGGAGGPVPGAIRDLLEIASNNTDRLIQLVNDILEIFRMETGRLKLQPAPVAIDELVNTSREKAQKEASAAKIRLETRVSPGVPPALADTEQVEVVLEKLISNAIKFSRPGGVVRIGAESMPDNPKFLLLWVQDFGRGIPAEAQGRIFEKFEQADSVMTRQHQGPGLGLSICRGIVEGHGGRIWVKSELDKGSTFYVSLPVAHSLPRKPAVAAAPPSGRVAKAHHLVMVVDDDPDTRSVISRMLQSEGHFVVEVGHGSQVADLALRHRPEIITLDMIMPGVDGIEVLRRLKADEKTRTIPVICISISEDLAPQALQLGAARFIRKPLEPATLLQVIHQVCSAAAGSAG
ncbi:MAG: hypothetical protein A3H28_15550 [Acidobacteria bacterium RIFCSPLOWO2_02_FULL_61_28]|nr:MAG: hypothetical protein A3H28_15550 [Acidobacteria bacterium RIFCSPLOWO2_02_FULL_61_28]